MGVQSVHEALGIYTHDVHRRWGSVVASSGGRGRASSAAACPSLGGRTPTSFTTARCPRPRTAERLDEAEAWLAAEVHPGVVRGARAAAGL
jgi:hypothetical protein